jgi:hypothetical protein
MKTHLLKQIARYTICSILLSMIGSSAIAKDTSFSKFLKSFKQIESHSAYRVGEIELSQVNFADQEPITLPLAEKFLPASLVNEASVFYPIGRMDLQQGKYHALFYNQRTGSGGINENVYMAIYNRKGVLIDQILFASLTGDCSFTILMEGKLENQERVSVALKKIDYDCETDTVIKETFFSVQSYLITKNGIIQQI